MNSSREVKGERFETIGISAACYGALTLIEVTTLREAGQNTAASAAVVEAIVIGIIIAVVEVAGTILYSEWARDQDCKRGVLIGNNQIVRDIRHCQSQGKSFTIHDSSYAACGAGAGATCN